MSTITTAGETFTDDSYFRMAWLVYVRFGRSIKSGADAWRRMLQNCCTNDDFEEMVNKGALLSVEDGRQV